MAYNRKDAIDKCNELGEQFIEHFYTTYTADIDDENFLHHCREMQTWYNKARCMTLKPKDKKLDIDQMVNWFFTAGGSIEYMFNEDDDIIDAYSDFVKYVLTTNNIKESFEKIL